MEFKVGQKYAVSDKRHSEHGNIIEITEVSGAHCLYKTVKGGDGMSGFDIGSIFGKSLIPYNDKKIVITTDGNTTIARMFENGKCVETAVAKCNPSDEFNFETGAKLAFERLFEEKRLKFEKGKRYIFDRKTFEKLEGGHESHLRWVKECDGKLVSVRHEYNGRIGRYEISPRWCIEAPAFKVGDRVRIIGNDTRIHHYYEIGEVVKVQRIDKDGDLHCISSNKHYQTVSPADVELITFKVGDRVRIREWNDMKKEFGLSPVGNIEVPYTFTTGMKHLCGRSAKITSLTEGGEGVRVHLDFDAPWSYSPEMLEPITFDWDKFGKSELFVLVTKDNFKDFVSEAKKHGFKFNPHENFNPFKATRADSFMRMIMPDITIKPDEIYITYEDDSLKVAHSAHGYEEYRW